MTSSKKRARITMTMFELRDDFIMDWAPITCFAFTLSYSAAVDE